MPTRTCWMPTLLASATLAALATPAHAVIGVYGRYFVTGAAAAGAPGSGGTAEYDCNSGPFDGGINSLTGCGINGGRTPSATSYAGTVDSTGRTTQFFADTTAHEFHTTYPDGIHPVTAIDPGFGRGRASANLADGTVHTRVDNNANLGYVIGTANATWHDIVTLQVAGAAANTVTRVQFRASFVGNWLNDGQTTVYGELGSGSLQGQFLLDSTSSGNDGSTNYNLRTGAGWEVYRGVFAQNAAAVDNRGDKAGGAWTTYTAGQMVYDGYFDILGTQAVINPTLRLVANCQIGLQCDYSGQFAFVGLPSSVSYSSDSGVFLTPVPEPENWALMLAGLGGLGLLTARRARTAG